jgi:hypothetical protein
LHCPWENSSGGRLLSRVCRSSGRRTRRPHGPRTSQSRH